MNTEGMLMVTDFIDCFLICNKTAFLLILMHMGGSGFPVLLTFVFPIISRCELRATGHFFAQETEPKAMMASADILCVVRRTGTAHLDHTVRGREMLRPLYQLCALPTAPEPLL